MLVPDSFASGDAVIDSAGHDCRCLRACGTLEPLLEPFAVISLDETSIFGFGWAWGSASHVGNLVCSVFDLVCTE